MKITKASTDDVKTAGLASDAVKQALRFISEKFNITKEILADIAREIAAEDTSIQSGANPRPIDIDDSVTPTE